LELTVRLALVNEHSLEQLFDAWYFLTFQ